MTINDIINEIIEEVAGDTADSALVTKMLSFFKAGYRRLPAFVRDRGFVGIDTYTLLTDSNTISVDEFSEFIREREVWFEGDGHIHIPIYKAPSLQYFHKVITPDYVGKPFYYRVYGRTMQFDRKCPVGLVIGVDYVKAVSAITLTDTWTPDEQIMEAAKHFCKMVYFSDYEEDAAKARENERRGKEIAQILEEEFEIQEIGSYVDEKY
jgi:hypothetical protein